MPSIAKIFSYAAVAFAAFAAAAPTPKDNNNLVNVHDVEVEDNNVLVGRDCACAEPNVPSLVGIVADLKADVKVDIDALLAVNVDTCTVAHIKPIVVSIVAKIEDASAKVVVLSKYKADQILFDGKVSVTIKVFADLLVELIVAICAAVEVCLRLCIKLNLSVEIKALLCLVVTAIARLLHCICGVLGGLVGELLAILCIKLQVCFWLFVKLNVLDLLVLLKINVAAYISL